MTPRHDVVILGAGPAGSTAANLLALEGHDVLVLEKEQFPRFHVGESLLPADLDLFARLGVEAGALSPYLRKRGAVFLDERSGDRVDFAFEDGLPGTHDHAFQVDRATFDHMLAEHAAARGAEFRYGVRAQSVSFEEAQVVVGTDSGDVAGRYLIDATGLAAFLAGKKRSRRRIDGLGLAAGARHYEGIEASARAELEATGDVLIFMLEEGWGWCIPLGGGRVSVGRVSSQRGFSIGLLDDFVKSSPLLSAALAPATQTRESVHGNFSFKNDEAYGARYACVGDSACFLDPVFSSGVTFAMFGGEKLADLLSPALLAGAEGATDLAAPLDAHMQHAYDVFAALCGRFYSADIVRRVFFYDSPDPAFAPGIVSVLAGDVFRDDNVFQNMLLSSRRRLRV